MMALFLKILKRDFNRLTNAIERLNKQGEVFPKETFALAIDKIQEIQMLSKKRDNDDFIFLSKQKYDFLMSLLERKQQTKTL